MQLNSDFSQRVVVHGAQLAWKDSPMPGVRRRMFDRIGAEIARATSIVSYAPNSAFSAHVHTGGEEFIVLEGVFEDEHGSFPVGSYVRNPPGSSHTPASKPGCVIFVKLWQFDPADQTHIVSNFDQAKPTPDLERPGVAVIPLYQDERETVRVEQFSPDVQAIVDTEGGAELLVLDGGFDDGHDQFSRHSWLRVPIGGRALVKAGPEGTRLWVKNGHLNYAKPPAA